MVVEGLLGGVQSFLRCDTLLIPIPALLGVLHEAPITHVSTAFNRAAKAPIADGFRFFVEELGGGADGGAGGIGHVVGMLEAGTGHAVLCAGPPPALLAVVSVGRWRGVGPVKVTWMA